MLIGISGTISSGKKEVVRYLTFQGFQLIGLDAADDVVHSFDSTDALVDFATGRWRDNFVLYIDDGGLLEILQKRPFFLHISVDAPIQMRYKRHLSKHNISLEEFVAKNDAALYRTPWPMMEINNHAQVKIINTLDLVTDLFVKLSELNLMDKERLRPSWDLYFMRLADLAALRSNCMKRRVGAVIVRKSRVVATGYNGTPRHLTNCNEGGCPRCNNGQGLGASLSTCLCLHAEENALLEAGRDRMGDDLVVYCNTCPCLTCSIKIIQSGIKEVVYAQSYLMDEASHRVMREAGVILRQFQPPKDGIFI